MKWHLAVGGREASHRQRLAGRSEHTEEVFMVLEETVRMNYTVNRRHEAVIYSALIHKQHHYESPSVELTGVTMPPASGSGRWEETNDVCMRVKSAVV